MLLSQTNQSVDASGKKWYHIAVITQISCLTNHITVVPLFSNISIDEHVGLRMP